MAKAAILVSFLITVSSGRVTGQSPYREMNVENPGMIRGQVRLQAGAKEIATMEITKDDVICGTSCPSPRLATGKNRGVMNSVVFLESVSQGKRRNGTMRPSINQTKCQYSPHVTVVPIGAQLEIVNSDPILHNVHAYEGESRVKTIFNIAQPVKGQRTSIKQMQLNTRGLVLLTCDAGHPWMSAYIIVADHPYIVVSDRQGNFILDEVPPGSYRVKMWHEGILVTSEQLERGKVSRYFFEEPYEIVQDVIVPPNGVAKVDFEITLRQ